MEEAHTTIGQKEMQSWLIRRLLSRFRSIDEHLNEDNLIFERTLVLKIERAMVESTNHPVSRLSTFE